MNKERRKFIGSAAAGVFLGCDFLRTLNAQDTFLLAKPDIQADNLTDAVAAPGKNVFEHRIIPKGLRKGSKVAILAPASPTSMGEIARCVQMLKKQGCSVVIGKTINQRDSKYKYFSASDEERANELMEYFQKPDIDAIIAGRGGFGVTRILPMLDYEIIRQNPKIVLGFSDITALINAIYLKSNLVCYHGPVAASNWGQASTASFLQTVFYNEKTEPIKYVSTTSDVLFQGVAEGRIVGGNLTVVAGSLGTPYEIDTKDSILFLEEVSEEPYKIDRMLTQLWLAGKLQQCNGIVFGYFKNLTARKNFWPVISFTVKSVIESRIKQLNIPSIIGFPIGHHENNITLPIGIRAELNTKTKILTIIEKTCV